MTEAKTTGPSTRTLELDREESLAVFSACVVLLRDLLAIEGAGGRFPDAARPLFRVYLKMAALVTIQADLVILKAGQATWGRLPQ